MTRPENPAAFPVAAYSPMGGELHEAGMTLRDWFAGQALAGRGAIYSGRSDDSRARRAVLYGEVAEELYAIADALLAERAKGDGQ